MEITIGKRKIGPRHPPFVLAEMSGNHNQSLKRALKIIEEAAKTGVDGVKLQTYTADTMTLDISEREFFIDDPGSPWKGQSLHQLYKQAHTPWEWHRPIYEKCEELGLLCFSTPFDTSAVDFLESLDSPAYKIASFENTDCELVKKVAALGKPLIISTGMASISELAESVSVARQHGAEQIILLKCTSSYPASPTSSHVATIPHMKTLFGCQVGLSDHTLGIGVAVAAVALGATFIEKHFTLSRQEGGVDADFSLEPAELKLLVQESRRAWQGLGSVHYGPTTKEEGSRLHRRSLYVSKDIKSGDIFSRDNIKAIRPGLGLPVKYLEIFLGKRANQEIKRGSPLSFDLIG